MILLFQKMNFYLRFTYFLFLLIISTDGKAYVNKEKNPISILQRASIFLIYLYFFNKFFYHSKTCH